MKADYLKDYSLGKKGDGAKISASSLFFLCRKFFLRPKNYKGDQLWIKKLFIMKMN